MMAMKPCAAKKWTAFGLLAARVSWLSYKLAAGGVDAAIDEIISGGRADMENQAAGF